MRKAIQSLTAISLAAAMLCGCGDNTAQSDTVSQDISEEVQQTPLPVAEHRLQEITILVDTPATGTELPPLKRPDESNPHLYFQPLKTLSAFLFRDWSATDLSAYKQNGYIALDIKGGGEASFDIGFGDMIKGSYSTSVITHTESGLTDEWKSIHIPISDIDSDMLHVRDFVIGNAEGEFFVSNIRLCSEDSEKIYPLFKVNQCGYKPSSEKTAILSGFGDVIGCNVGDEFELVNAADNAAVYSGRLTLITEIDEKYSGEAMLCADFTEYTAEGEYYLRLKNNDEEKSLSFVISEDAYDKVLTDTMRYFYYQRANTDITSDYGDGFTRDDITPEDYALPLKNDSTQTIDASGGWYDAGDIGKYVVPGATAANTLLWAYKLYPEKFSDGQNNIPESSNGIPDILDEVRYELDFFLRMQDEQSGGFYMKVKSATEQDDANDRVVWECTTNTTADTSAVLAFASTIYREFDSAYADILLAAAEKGWTYIEANPNYYVETTYAGEMNTHSTFWAAGCLALASDKDIYHNYVKENYDGYLSVFSGGKDGHSVGNMAYYGYYAYLLSENADPAIRDEINTRFGQWCSGAEARHDNNPWEVSLLDWSFWWGSFNMVLGTPQDMLVGCYVLGRDNTKAMQMSGDALSFILGENPMRKSFVTGNGEDAIFCTFSSFYGNEDSFPSGYMPGGMNAYDGSIISQYPMKCYVDEPFDWVTNENAIYWNAVMVFNTAAQR